MCFFPQRVTITKSVSPLWQHKFERGLNERLKAWIASPENAENIQKQLSCCLPSHPLKSPACLTTSPACLPTSSLEATCSSTMPSCFSVLSLRYHNLLIALLGLSHFSMKSWFPSYNQIQHNVYFIKMDLLSKSKQRMAVNIHTPPDPVIHVKENLFYDQFDSSDIRKCWASHSPGDSWDGSDCHQRTMNIEHCIDCNQNSARKSR